MVWQVVLPHGRAAQVDAFPCRRMRDGTLQRRWLLLGRLPARGLRPTLAAGSIASGGGAFVVDYGCASLEALEQLRIATSSVAGQ
jgi:hypothetical protein